MTRSDSGPRETPGLTHRIESDEKSTRVYLHGEIDMRVAPTLRAILHDVIDQSGREIIVDLTDVPFIDSSGVATFVEALRILSRSNRALRLENPTEAVRYTFKITQLLKVFGIEEKSDE